MPLTLELPDNPSTLEMRSGLEEAGEYLNGLRQRRQNGDEVDMADVRSATDLIHMLDPMLQAAEALEGRGPAAATAGAATDGAFRSVGAQVIDDSGYREFAQEGRSESGAHAVEVRGSLGAQPELRALVTVGETDGTGGSAFLPQAQMALPPIVRQRPIRLRDIMNVQTTGLANVPYIREGHANEDGADFTAEGATKNEVSMDWTQQDAPVRKITAWLPMTTEAIEDAPTLRGYIDGRLVYLIDVAEEEAILAGPGTGVTIRGILNHSGLQEADFDADIVAALGMAIGAVEDHDGAADGVVMRPTDYWTTVTSRHSTQFDGGMAGVSGTALPFTSQSANLPMWGLPVVRSRSCPADTAIVGAFRQAATLFDRLRTTIRIGNQHSTYFVENKVAVVAEERLALAVHRPDLFVSVPLVEPAP